MAQTTTCAGGVEPFGWRSGLLGLLDRGWSAADVRKVLGENWLRVYEKAWGA